jgi:EpsI family protein
VSHRWRLGIVLGLLVGAAGAAYGTPPVPESETLDVLERLPTTLAGWTARDGIPESLLPPDPHEMAAVRRTYRSGQRIAWISVALFTRQDDPLRRVSVNHVYPEQQVALVEPVDIRVALDGSSPTTLRARVIHRGGEQHAIVYWHQIQRRTYGSEYSFRWALMRRILVARRGDSVLVRIAVPVDQTDPARSLAGVAELGPPLHAALAGMLSD